MKSEKNILIAFILNLAFSVFEFFGGLFTGSIAIISDAIHDIGDAASIGISYFLEKKSKKQLDEIYTYGYSRYSIVGSFITICILLFGSVIVIYNAIGRILSPTEINYSGMIVFAIVGVFINVAAAFVTRDADTLNQKAVNLHMLEDVLGWIIVLAGAVVMHFTDFKLLDPIMSIGVSVFIFWNAFKNLKEILDLFLEKTPKNIYIEEITDHLSHIDGVKDVHHIHIWRIDERNVFATMHIVTNGDHKEIKKSIREELREYGISHATLELESELEHCEERECRIDLCASTDHHHHHHHH